MLAFANRSPNKGPTDSPIGADTSRLHFNRALVSCIEYQDLPLPITRQNNRTRMLEGIERTGADHRHGGLNRINK